MPPFTTNDRDREPLDALALVVRSRLRMWEGPLTKEWAMWERWLAQRDGNPTKSGRQYNGPRGLARRRGTSAQDPVECRREPPNRSG